MKPRRFFYVFILHLREFNLKFNKIKMKKHLAIATVFAIFLSSCVSQKKYAELETLQQNTKSLLDTATVKLNTCNEKRKLLKLD